MNQMMSWCQPPGQLERCWNDVQAVEEFLIKAINDILAKNPNAFGTVGALVGVTNGSIAQPGQVGEIIEFGTTVAMSAGVDQVALTTMGTLPAGDWRTFLWTSTAQTDITLIQIDNIPTTNLDLTAAEEVALLPPGVGWMALEYQPGAQSPGGVYMNLPGIPSYARTAGPVQVILRTITTSVSASNVGVGFQAWRVR